MVFKLFPLDFPLFFGFVLFMKNVMSSIAARREEKAIAKARTLAEAKKGGETE